jgi:hypothetical protein
MHSGIGEPRGCIGSNLEKLAPQNFERKRRKKDFKLKYQFAPQVEPISKRICKQIGKFGLALHRRRVAALRVARKRLVKT